MQCGEEFCYICGALYTKTAGGGKAKACNCDLFVAPTERLQGDPIAAALEPHVVPNNRGDRRRLEDILRDWIPPARPTAGAGLG